MGAISAFCILCGRGLDFYNDFVVCEVIVLKVFERLGYVLKGDFVVDERGGRNCLVCNEVDAACNMLTAVVNADERELLVDDFGVRAFL